MNNPSKNGVLLLDKDSNMTSFLCCSVLRGLLGIQKIGHAGTLDPMATGVLPILCGNATKALNFLPVHDKSYLASFQLGKTSDTQDIWGTVTAITEHYPKKQDVLNALKQFEGTITQIPPMMSAKKVDGVRLYSLARQGIEIERKPQTVEVYTCRLESYDEQTGEGTLFCHVSKGTYIRSLCHDLGQQLQTGAIMTSLKRTMASGYTLDQCVTLESLRQMEKEKRLSLLLPTDSIFATLPEITVTAAQSTRFQNGGSLFLDRLENPVCETVRVYSPAHTFLGLGSPKDDQLSPLKLFP